MSFNKPGLTVALLGLMLQGCLRAPSLEPLREDIQSQMQEARFDKELKLTLGPLSLLMARTLCRLIPDREVQEIRRMLAQVHRVEVAIYKVEAPEGYSSRKMPTRLRAMVDSGRWQLAVRTQEKDERVWILYRERDGEVRDFYVATLGTDELVMVRVAGNLQRLVTQALSQEGLFRSDKHRDENGSDQPEDESDEAGAETAQAVAE